MGEIFPEVPDRTSILIWTPRGKKSYWANTTDSAVDAAHQVKGDAYLGCCLGPSGISEDKRALASEVVAIPGLWADIDIAGEAHKGKSYPKTEKDARQLISELPIQPTIIVHSGHGLQPWWLFPELLVFDKPEERFESAKISRGWNRLIIRTAKAHGWQCDNVGDLARVMRVAGTDNHKGAVVPCLIPDTGGPRAQLEDFDQFLTEEDYKDTGVDVVDGNWTYHVEAQPPAEQFAVALQNDKEFADTWHAKRPELHGNASRYDQALANRAANFKWSAQEIVNLLIAFRRKHGFKLDEKMRDSYFVPTLNNAMTYAAAQAKRNADTDERSMLAQIGRAGEGDHKTKYRNERLKKLEDDLGFKIDGLLKTVEDEPVYILVISGTQYPIGHVTTLQRQDRFEAAVMKTASRTVPDFKRDQWKSIVQMMLDLCEPLELDTTATNQGMVDHWMVSYLAEHNWVDADVEEEVPDNGAPFVKEINQVREVCVKGDHLYSEWVRAPGQADNMTKNQMQLALRRAGWVPRPVRVSDDLVLRRWIKPLHSVIEAARNVVDVTELLKRSDRDIGSKGTN